MVKLLVLAVSIFALTGCGFFADLSLRSEIKEYQGDGVIYTCSNALMGGYGIDFPRFDASRPFTATYHFSHVPPTRLPWLQPFLYLRHGAFPKDESPPDDVKAGLRAKFLFTIHDSHGQVAHAELPLATAIWGSDGVYDLDRSRVGFQKDTNYELRVEYSPGVNPPPVKEFYVVIDRCASY
jgi:opacity protein-like surface antigen